MSLLHHRIRAVVGAAIGVASAALLAACGGGSSGGSPSPSPSASTSAAPSHATPAGAMTGLLTAMKSGDAAAVTGWISPTPSSDRASIASTAGEAQGLNLGSVFWEVAPRHVTSVRTVSPTAADVTLDGYLVWCLGSGTDDPKASCAQPNGAGDQQTTTYPAVKVGNQWYIDIDLNRGQLIKGNPGAAGVGASAAPSAATS